MIIRSVLFTLLFALFTFAAIGNPPSDSIKGEWVGVFSIAGHTADVMLKFDVHDSKVTGTVNSEHTGPGTVTDGEWKDGKLTCTLKFEKHESMAFTGWLKDGKLEGEFKTEGMTGTFVASRKP